MQKNDILKNMSIETTGILLASIVSLHICNITNVSQWIIPFSIVAIHTLIKLVFILCRRDSKCSYVPSKEINVTRNSECKCRPQEHREILKKRMELFHQEYSLEQQLYLQQKEKEQSIKLEKILKYTRDTFKRLNFEEVEVFQLCECVRYLVTNSQVLSNVEITIHKRASVTQISLKNFAWNVAFQYNISGDTTTEFIMTTFKEWFVNSTFDTIRKNLRTTTGRHQIEIDEHII